MEHDTHTHTHTARNSNGGQTAWNGNALARSASPGKWATNLSSWKMRSFVVGCNYRWHDKSTFCCCTGTAALAAHVLVELYLQHGHISARTYSTFQNMFIHLKFLRGTQFRLSSRKNCTMQRAPFFQGIAFCPCTSTLSAPARWKWRTPYATYPCVRCVNLIILCQLDFEYTGKTHTLNALQHFIFVLCDICADYSFRAKSSRGSTFIHLPLTLSPFLFTPLCFSPLRTSSLTHSTLRFNPFHILFICSPLPNWPTSNETSMVTITDTCRHWRWATEHGVMQLIKV